MTMSLTRMHTRMYTHIQEGQENEVNFFLEVKGGRGGNIGFHPISLGSRWQAVWLALTSAPSAFRANHSLTNGSEHPMKLPRSCEAFSSTVPAHWLVRRCFHIIMITANDHHWSQSPKHNTWGGQRS